MIKRLIILITDIAIAVSLLLGIWIYYYKAPRYGVHAVPSLEDIIYQSENSEKLHITIMIIIILLLVLLQLQRIGIIFQIL